MRSTTNYQSQFIDLTQNSASTNSTRGLLLVNQALAYLTGKFYFNERTYTTTTVAQQQFYNLPPQVKQIIDVTVTIGGIIWIPRNVATREEWDALNVITFYQDFPSRFYIYNGQLGLFPSPASSGNTLTMNYKIRDRDLSQADYTTGTVSINNASPTITGSGTTFIPDMVNRWIQITAPTGDNQWYQIQTYNSATSLTLFNNYTGINVSGENYIIGEMPILTEEYQDLPLYRALYIYFNSIVPNKVKAELYKGLYDEGYAMLNAEYGQKTTNVVLDDRGTDIINPNLYLRNVTQL